MQVKIFFNYRSPYGYLASRSMFERLASFKVEIEWLALAGWDGRSAPERAKVKVPLTRQDVKRWCLHLNIPFTPPPIETDPTLAAMVSYVAVEEGRLAEFTRIALWKEWAEGKDIGDRTTMLEISREVGLDLAKVKEVIDSKMYLKRLENNWAEAQRIGVIGVPSFVVDDQIFWGNDRLDFLVRHLQDLGLGSETR